MSDEPSNAASEHIRITFAWLSEAAAPSADMVRAGVTDDFVYEDRRSGPNFPDADAETVVQYLQSMWDTGAGQPRWETDTLAVRGERFAAVAIHTDYGNGMVLDSIDVVGLDANLSRLYRQVAFDRNDIDGAIAELDRLHREEDAG